MKINRFYSLILVLVLFFYSCSNFDANAPQPIAFKEIKEKAHLAENNNKIDSAFYYLNTITQEGHFTTDNIVYSKLEKARLYYTLCDFSECEAETIEAIAINTNPVYNSYLHNMLGTAFQQKKEFQLAAEQLFLASKNTTDPLQNAVIQNNLGVIYLESKAFKKAILTLEPLLYNDILKDSPLYYSKAVDNLGYAYLNTGLPDAKSLLEKGLHLRDSIEDDYGKIASLIHLAKLFEKESDFDKANHLAIKAYEVATKINSPDDRLESLDLIIKNTTTTQTVKWFHVYSFLNDSIQEVRNKHKNQFAKIKYDASKSEAQSILLKAQKEKLSISIVAITLLAFISFILIRIKNKQKQLKTVYDTETRISKQLHDELANDVFNTLTFIETQDIATAENKEKIVTEIDRIYKQTRSISYENSSIETGTAYPTALRVLLNTFATPEIQVATKGIEDVDWNRVIPVKKIALYRVLQELMVNMKKHSQCSLVFVVISSNNKTLEIKYRDNGVGLTQNNFKIGLQNVENRINSIKGTITFESNTGLKVTIHIPI